MTQALAAKAPVHGAPFKPLAAIGLMSGTSMDGVDAAFVVTDGVGAIERGPALTLPYAGPFRARLKAFITGGGKPGPEATAIEAELTDLHMIAVEKLRGQLGATEIDLVGFHGQTIWHHPERRETWQMGDGARLARALAVPVAFDFRTADVEAGGQGAPLLPIFHAALAPRGAPLAILNVGGVANITWIAGRDAGAGGKDSDEVYEQVFAALLGFDTGPGNGLIDDWVAATLQLPMDAGGRVAARGRVDDTVLNAMLRAPFLAAPPPKSLDRFAFSTAPVKDLSPEDGAATLTAFTAACAARALDHCPERPAKLFVAGGGRHNAGLMDMLARYTGVAIGSVDELGWQGDALEAQAFAYLAVRSLRGLPITFPGTTGTERPLTGGRVAEPDAISV